RRRSGSVARSPCTLLPASSGSSKRRGLRHLLDPAGPPRLVEPRLQRTVKPQDHVPAFPRPGLDPVRFFAGRRLRTEVHIHRLVRIDGTALLLAADAWELLIGLELRSRLVVVKHD